MRTKATSFGALCCALLLLGSYLSLGRSLLADKADSPTPTPVLSEFDFVPLILSARRGPEATATSAPPTQTPFVTTTPSTTPQPTSAATATATGPAPSVTPTVTGQTPEATATAMPTATNIPDILPTLETNPLRVLDNHTLWIDDFGRLIVRGEVENTGPEPLRAVRVETQFHNRKGKVFHTEEALTLLNHLGPGEKTCFSLTIDPPDKWKSYSIGDVTYQLDPEPVSGLEVSGVSSGPDDLLGWYFVGGQLTNASVHHYDLVRLVGTVYAADGTVIGCDFAYTFNSELAQGQTDSFEIFFADRDYAQAADLHIQAEGEVRR